MKVCFEVGLLLKSSFSVVNKIRCPFLLVRLESLHAAYRFEMWPSLMSI